MVEETENIQGIEYMPPESETIRAFARRVCERLAIHRNDPTIVQPQVIRWLSELLEIAARVQAKRLNAGERIDSHEK